MSDPRAIPDEERPFIPEEQIPPKESTDFDAGSVDAEAEPADDEEVPDPVDSHE